MDIFTATITSVINKVAKYAHLAFAVMTFRTPDVAAAAVYANVKKIVVWITNETTLKFGKKTTISLALFASHT